jgi:hypothetical protein
MITIEKRGVRDCLIGKVPMWQDSFAANSRDNLYFGGGG